MICRRWTTTISAEGAPPATGRSARPRPSWRATPFSPRRSGAWGNPPWPGGAQAPAIEEIDLKKTAALLSAAAAMGGVLGGGTGEQVECLSRYGRALGLLFQITDDILEETGSFEEMGKAVAKDRERGKFTSPAALGMAAAAARAESLRRESLLALSPFGEEAETLRDIVRMVATRRS